MVDGELGRKRRRGQHYRRRIRAGRRPDGGAPGGGGQKRKFDAVYPAIAQDEEGASCPLWRSGLFSDWVLRLGSREFKVHKVIVGFGDRRSSFLTTAFTTAICLPPTAVDASLPYCPCYQY